MGFLFFGKTKLPHSIARTYFFKNLIWTGLARDIIPLHKLISLQQASYIRAGLEDKRQDFFNLINNLLKEAESLVLQNEKSFLEAKLDDIKESAQEFNNELNRQIGNELTGRQQNLKSYWYAGCSLTFPVVGKLVDIFINSSYQLGIGEGLGSILTLGSFLALRNIPKTTDNKIKEIALSSREKAYIFMNKLWEIHRSKLAGLQFN